LTTLPAKIVALHDALKDADLPHAFGGALALAWCTHRARGTIDIDVNVFVGVDRADAVFAAMPRGVKRSDDGLRAVRQDGQVRLWWEKTPVDVFLNTTELHAGLVERTRWETFAGRSIPFLSCNDLAVFKAFFNRTKDRADLEDMHAAGTLDVARVIAVLVKYLGTEDERIDHLRRVAPSS
jgi:hypothetical protein